MVSRSGWIACSVCVVIGAALLIFSGCVSGGVLRRTLQLADGGKPLADIVIAPDADENLKFAAAELKEHLDNISTRSPAGILPSSIRRAKGRSSLRSPLLQGLQNRKSAYRFPIPALRSKAAHTQNTQSPIFSGTTAG